jgi:hypothetical protein
LLFHHSDNGKVLFATTDGIGNISTLRQYKNPNWNTHWLIIPGSFGGDGKTDLLFYKYDNGLASFGLSTGGGNLSYTKQHEDWDKDWSTIIPGKFGGGGYTDLLFCKRSGIALFASTDGKGNITTIKEHNDRLLRGWDKIVPGNFGGDGYTDLLFYRFGRACEMQGLYSRAPTGEAI